MAIDTIECSVLCPYYVRHSKKKYKPYYITCENLIPEERLGFSLEEKLCFRDRNERTAYMEGMCCDRYQDCPRYKAIEHARGDHT